MAWEVDGVVKLVGHTAGADLSGKQYHLVKLAANKTVVVCAAVTDVPIGVLQNTPTSGQAAEVCIIGISKIVADANLATTDLIGTSADGQAAKKTPGTDTTNYVIGQVLEDNTAVGGLITAVINCAAPSRAA
jgi:hypothetical protein